MNPGMGLARIRELLQRLIAPIDPTLMMIAAASCENPLSTRRCLIGSTR